MTILVLGSSGKVGSLIVEQLLASNHNLRVFVHKKSSFEVNDHLEIFRGDVRSGEDIVQALDGCDVVISTLASWGTPTKDILSVAMKNIIAESKQDIRVISLTGADARASSDKPNFVQKITHALFGKIAGKVMADGEAHIQALANSTLNWSVVRSPVMNNLGKKNSYILTQKLPMPWATINRASVASAMVHLALSDDYVKQAPIIRRA